MDKKRPDSEFTKRAHALRVTVSPELTPENLRLLRELGLSAKAPRELIELIRGVGGDKLSVVYMVKEGEIDNLTEFAREFTVWLREDADARNAYQSLKNSPLIVKVEPVGFSRAF